MIIWIVKLEHFNVNINGQSLEFWWNGLMKMWIICGLIVSPTFGHRLYCRSIVDDHPSLEKHKVIVHHKHTPRLRQSSALSHGFTKLTCHLPRGLTIRTTSNWSIQTANNRDYTGTISTTTSHPRDIHVTSTWHPHISRWPRWSKRDPWGHRTSHSVHPWASPQRP